MTSGVETIRAGEINGMAVDTLVRFGASRNNAALVARAMTQAEIDGNAVCGLFYLPIFCGHLRCGKVNGKIEPIVEASGATVAADARHGFAHPAIAAGLPMLATAARNYGVAALSVRNSYNCLTLAHHVVPLAEQGLIGLCVANAPAAVAPPGGLRPLFGTNPIAFACPAGDGAPIVVDQSMSAVTKTEMVMRRESGTPIPPGWAQDSHGRPTTSAELGLGGSLLASGGQKGANIALLVEILAAALTGSTLSIDAASFGDDKGGPPATGQFILALDPGRFGAARFDDQIERLSAAFGAAGVRLPGRQRALESEWADLMVEVKQETWRKAIALARP